MIKDAKKIAARLIKCRERLGIKQIKPRDGGMPLGIDQSSISRWEKGQSIPGGGRQEFAAWCCYVGMSFEDVPTSSVEKFIPESVEPKDAKLIEAVVSDLIALEAEGFALQNIATHIKAIRNHGKPAPIPAEDRPMLEGLDKLALAQIQKGLSLVLGNVSSDSPEYDACMHALQTVKRSNATLEPKHPPQESGVGQSPIQADGL